MAPIFFGACLVAYLVHFQFGSAAMSYVAVIVYFLCMNLVHTSFTFVMLMRVPAFRAYLASRSSFFMTPVGLGSLTLLLFTGFYLFNLSKFGWGSSGVFHVIRRSQIIQIGFIFWNGYHVRKQMLGLSLLYDRKTLLAEKRSVLSEKAEKFIFAVFCLSLLGRLCMSRYFGETVWCKFSIWAIVAAEFVLCATLVLWTFFRSGAAKNKGVYQLRFFFFPLSVVSVAADYALQSLHGIEYFFLTQQVLDNSGLERSKARSTLIFGLLLGACVFVPYYVLYFAAPLRHGLFGELVPLWALVALGLAKTVVFLHFHIDGYLFRFSDPNVRKHIVPLLIPEPSAGAISKNNSTPTQELRAV